MIQFATSSFPPPSNPKTYILIAGIILLYSKVIRKRS